MKFYTCLGTLLMALMLGVALTHAQAVTESPNPFEPTELAEIAAVLGEAVANQHHPEDTAFAIVVNDVAPFWTAAQIASHRAARELGVPLIFDAAVKPGNKDEQRQLIQGYLDAGYQGISFSAIDPSSLTTIIKQGVEAGVQFIAIDSDAPDTGRLLYLGTDNYRAGVAAGEVLLETLGEAGGQVVALVGTLTAPNAIERIRGIEDTIQGTNVTLEAILIDDLDPLKAESNAEQALLQYPNLAAFVTIYSYDGPAAGNALKITGMVGKVKVVAFDLEPDTIRLLNEGAVSAAIGQRPYFWGYLSVYTLYAAVTLGSEETLRLLEPYFTDPTNRIIDTGVDIVTADTLDTYLAHLNSIGIWSQ